MIISILQFLKNYWKPLSYVILVLAIVILFMLLKSETYRANEAEAGRDAAIVLSNKWQNFSQLYKNKYGDEVHKTKVLELDKTNIAALSKDRELSWLDKFNGLKKDKSNLKSAETFEMTFESEDVGRDTIYVPCKDSVKAFHYHYKDAWNNIEAIVIDTPRLEMRDRYYAVIELKRPKGWFWKFQWSKHEAISEITNSNKLIKIDSIAVITVK